MLWTNFKDSLQDIPSILLYIVAFAIPMLFIFWVGNRIAWWLMDHFPPLMDMHNHSKAWWMSKGFKRFIGRW